MKPNAWKLCPSQLATLRSALRVGLSLISWMWSFAILGGGLVLCALSLFGIAVLANDAIFCQMLPLGLGSVLVGSVLAIIKIDRLARTIKATAP